MIIPITPLRKEITDILDKPEIISSISGIRLIEKRDFLKDHLEGFNCVRYCFEKNKPLWENVYTLPEILMLPIGEHSEVETPREGDIAVYVGSYEGDLEFTHVGRVSSEGIISKFGYRDVYSHSPEIVPDSYGEILRFFRKK